MASHRAELEDTTRYWGTFRRRRRKKRLTTDVSSAPILKEKRKAWEVEMERRARMKSHRRCRIYWVLLAMSTWV